MLELASLIKNMKKSSRSQVKKKKLPSHINEAKTFKLMENPFSFVKSPKKVFGRIFRTRDNIVSQNESLHRHSVSNSDHLSLLIQNMHQTLKQINRKLRFKCHYTSFLSSPVEVDLNELLLVFGPITHISREKNPYFEEEQPDL